MVSSKGLQVVRMKGGKQVSREVYVAWLQFQQSKNSSGILLVVLSIDDSLVEMLSH